MFDECRDIVHPLSQGREGHGNHCEPVIEIFTERILLDCTPNVFVRGRDEAHIGANRLGSAHTKERLILNDPEEAAL